MDGWSDESSGGGASIHPSVRSFAHLCVRLFVPRSDNTVGMSTEGYSIGVP